MNAKECLEELKIVVMRMEHISDMDDETAHMTVLDAIRWVGEFSYSETTERRGREESGCKQEEIPFPDLRRSIPIDGTLNDNY